jgi:sulfotransferase
VETLAKADRLVGSAYLALRDGFYSEHSGSMLVIEYDRLVRKPLEVLRRLYDVIGEPWFEHDVDNVAFDAPEFDAALGIEGMHHVRPKVEHKPRRTVLPPDLFEKYNRHAFWLSQEGSAAQVIAKPAPAALAAGSLVQDGDPGFPL